MLETQKLYSSIEKGEYDEAIALIDKNPQILVRIGYLSMSCAGGWGMPMYAHIGTFLDRGHKASEYSKKHQKSKQMRLLCEKVFEKAPEIFTNYNDDLKYSLASNYALRAGWTDILKDCEQGGYSLDKMKDLAKGIKELPKETEEYLALPRTFPLTGNSDVPHTPGDPEDPEDPGNPRTPEDPGNDEDTCCICLDALRDAVFYPCAHTELCFDCSRDLITCPICRTEGYAKKMIK